MDAFFLVANFTRYRVIGKLENLNEEAQHAAFPAHFPPSILQRLRFRRAFIKHFFSRNFRDQLGRGRRRQFSANATVSSDAVRPFCGCWSGPPRSLLSLFWSYLTARHATSRLGRRSVVIYSSRCLLNRARKKGTVTRVLLTFVRWCTDGTRRGTEKCVSLECVFGRNRRQWRDSLPQEATNHFELWKNVWRVSSCTSEFCKLGLNWKNLKKGIT